MKLSNYQILYIGGWHSNKRNNDRNHQIVVVTTGKHFHFSYIRPTVFFLTALVAILLLHCVQKKTPAYIFLHIFMIDV